MSDSEVRSFVRDLDAFARAMNIEANVVVRKVAFDVFTAIVKKTPVDTGLARNSWKMGINNIVPAGIGSKGRTDTTAAQLEKLARFKIGRDIIIINNVPYIVFLEDGSSKQAPVGMVRLSIAEVQAGIAGAL